MKNAIAHLAPLPSTRVGFIFFKGNNHVKCYPVVLFQHVAQILGYADQGGCSQAIQQHCKRVKPLNLFVAQNECARFNLSSKSLVIPEADLYRLVFKATSAVARKLQDDLLNAVINTDLSEIPEIRKYSDFISTMPLKVELVELYVVLFSTGVIKVGKGKNAFKRVKVHSVEAARFGVTVTNFFIEKNPQITEEDLIKFCLLHGTLCNGNEYFNDLDYATVVNFVKRKLERKVLRLVR